jgi:hypothetical protein
MTIMKREKVKAERRSKAIEIPFSQDGAGNVSLSMPVFPENRGSKIAPYWKIVQNDEYEFAFSSFVRVTHPNLLNRFSVLCH